MMKDSSFSYSEAFRTLFLAILVAYGIGVAQAQWVNPPNTPNNCPSGSQGCDLPINTGSTAQTKTGSFTAGNLLTGGTLNVAGDTTLTGISKVVGGLVIGSTNGLDANAVLQIDATNKGFLPPRLPTASLPSGASNGTIAFDTTTNELKIKTSSGWQALSVAGAVAGVNGPAFRVSKSSDQALTNGGTTLITWNSTEDFDQGNVFSGGRFTPTVPGQYLVSARLAVQNGSSFVYDGFQAPKYSLQLYKSPSSAGTPALEQESVFETSLYYYPALTGYIHDARFTHTLNLDVIVNVTQQNVTDGAYYDIRTYTDPVRDSNYNLISMNAKGVATKSVFSASRVGNPVSYNTTQNITVVEAPIGAVMFFDLTACPSAQGWTDYTQAQGRYVVGAVSGATVGGVVGTSFNNGSAPNNSSVSVSGGLMENRPAGKHTHLVTPYNPSNFISGNPRIRAYYGGETANVGPGYIAFKDAMTGTGHVPSSADYPPELVDGTSAPYVQLKTCKKTS